MRNSKRYRPVALLLLTATVLSSIGLVNAASAAPRVGPIVTSRMLSPLGASAVRRHSHGSMGTGMPRAPKASGSMGTGAGSANRTSGSMGTGTA